MIHEVRHPKIRVCSSSAWLRSAKPHSFQTVHDKQTGELGKGMTDGNIVMFYRNHE